MAWIITFSPINEKNISQYFGLDAGCWTESSYSQNIELVFIDIIFQMDFADLLKTSKRKINQEDGTKIDLKKVRGLSFKLYVSNFYVELQKVYFPIA